MIQGLTHTIEVCEKRRKSCPTTQLFAGLTDDKPVVIGLSENINLSLSVYLWIWTVLAGLFQYLNPENEF